MLYFNFDAFGLGIEFGLIDGMNLCPLIFYCNFFEFGFIGIFIPSSESALFFGKYSGILDIAWLFPIGEFIVFGDDFLIFFPGVAFYHHKFGIFFAGGYGG